MVFYKKIVGSRHGLWPKARSVWQSLRSNKILGLCMQEQEYDGQAVVCTEKSHQTRRETVMAITLRWNRQSGCRVQPDARPGNQMTSCYWKDNLFPFSFSVFSCVLLFLPLLSQALACLQCSAKLISIFFWWSSPDVAHHEVRKASDTVQCRE